MDGKAVNHDIMRTTSMYLVLYIGVFAISFLLVSIDNMDFTTSFTAVAANLNNTARVWCGWPCRNYADFSILSKIVFIFDMLAGRLEIYPLLLLFAPSAWKKS